MDTGLLIRLTVMVVLAVVAVGVAVVLQRRRPDPPSAPSYRAPSQLDRADFARPDAPILAVEFASTGCDTCPLVWEELQPLASDMVAVQRVDVEDDPDLHHRYRIDGVPTTMVVDGEGVVVQAFFGPVADDELSFAIDTLARSLND